MSGNDELILKSLMEINRDIGIIKGTQSSMKLQISDLDKSMEALELSYPASGPQTAAIQINKNQLVACVSAVILALCGVGVSL